MTAQMPDGSERAPRWRPQQIVQPGDRRLDAPLVGQPLRRAAHDQHRPERDDEGDDAEPRDEDAVDQAAERRRADAGERGHAAAADVRAQQQRDHDRASARSSSRPTDRCRRSTITTVMPSAAMQTIAVCRAISSRFAGREELRARRARRRRPRPASGRSACPSRSSSERVGHAAAPPPVACHHQLVLGQARRPGAAAPSRPRRITAMRSHRPSSSGR